jgi:Tol biopolymer transport system component
MKKHFRNLCVLLLSVMISGCTASSLQQPTDTPTLAPTIKHTTTLTATVTVTATVTPISEPSPTLVPSVVWAEPFENPIEIQGYANAWSPVSNEIAGISNPNRVHEWPNIIGIPMLAVAPDFEMVVLEDINADKVGGDLYWTPDGQKILYAVSCYGEIGCMEYGTLWMVDRNGSNPHELTGGYQWLEVWGFMDPDTVVVSGYSGGGHIHLDEYNILTNNYVTGDVVHMSQYEHSPINSIYVPVVDCQLYCTTCVLSRKKNTPYSMACRSEYDYAHEFPREDESFQYIDTTFQDWQPGTNNILILAQGLVIEKDMVKEGEMVSRLLLWNVDTNQVKSLGPGGLFGRYSQDGKYLVFLTLGSSDQYVSSDLQKITFDPVIMDSQPYLQLMNVSTKQIMLRVPVKTTFNESAGSNYGITEPDRFSFSPDGRYITFLTDGLISTTDAGIPTEALDSSSTTVYLNVLDIQTGQLMQSLPADGFEKWFRFNTFWSPDSTKFVYLDSIDNWQLFEMADGSITPITLSNGYLMQTPTWSYDASYLSFSSQYDFVSRTHILNLARRP